MHVPEIKHLIEVKTGIPRHEQDIFLDGCPEILRDECRLCHYADALFAKSPKICLVRRTPPEKLLGRSTFRRLQKEFQNAQTSDSLANCLLSPSSGNLEESPLRWKALIKVADGPYDGGAFALEISLPSDYPYKPPLVMFSTRVFHPLVASNGTIDLELLHEQWTPAATLESIVLKIKAMLTAPPYGITSCGGNHEAALLSHDKAAFDRRAQEETAAYAKLPI
jgi:ubiquitin-conjugating enzyme E2 D/E